MGEWPAERRPAGAPTFRRLTAVAKPPGPGTHEKADTNGHAQTQSRSQTGAPPASHPLLITPQSHPKSGTELDGKETADFPDDLLVGIVRVGDQRPAPCDHGVAHVGQARKTRSQRRVFQIVEPVLRQLIF